MVYAVKDSVSSDSESYSDLRNVENCEIERELAAIAFQCHSFNYRRSGE